jgi:hypothetical protein
VFFLQPRQRERESAREESKEKSSVEEEHRGEELPHLYERDTVKERIGFLQVIDILLRVWSGFLYPVLCPGEKRSDVREVGGLGERVRRRGETRRDEERGGEKREETSEKREKREQRREERIDERREEKRRKRREKRNKRSNRREEETEKGRKHTSIYLLRFPL